MPANLTLTMPRLEVGRCCPCGDDIPTVNQGGVAVHILYVRAGGSGKVLSTFSVVCLSVGTPAPYIH